MSLSALLTSELALEVTATRWTAALAPILILFVLVISGRVSAARSAIIASLTALMVAWIVFEAGAAVLGTALGKGLWTGTWILYVIWPALLLYQLANRAGLRSVGEHLMRILPTRTENILIVAWVLPSFIQGIAGFGTPIAVAAPLLVAMGLRPVRALALPLVGYHWSVTFGSMGSSFYMGAFTGGLETSGAERFALVVSIMLGTNAVIAGIMVAWMSGGRSAVRDARTMLVVCGGAMAASLVLFAQIEPSIASVASGAAGLCAVIAVRALRLNGVTRNPLDVGADPSIPAGGQWQWLRVLLPYGALIVIVLPVMVIPASRSVVRSRLLVGPSFDATSTGLGVVNDAVTRHSPIALLSHPGSFVLIAVAVGAIFYLRAGMIVTGDLPDIRRAWTRQALKASPPVLLLAALASIMVDSGMISIAARGAVEVTGSLFPLLSPTVGAFGSFASGSTTASNALLASLQRDAADLLGVDPPLLIAAQSAGGNVGNSLAPVVILVGASAVGAAEQAGEIARAVLVPALLLLASVTVLTAAFVWI